MLRGFQVFVSGIALAGFTLAGAGVASAQEPAKSRQARPDAGRRCGRYHPADQAG